MRRPQSADLLPINVACDFVLSDKSLVLLVFLQSVEGIMASDSDTVCRGEDSSGPRPRSRIVSLSFLGGIKDTISAFFDGLQILRRKAVRYDCSSLAPGSKNAEAHAFFATDHGPWSADFFELRMVAHRQAPKGRHGPAAL